MRWLSNVRLPRASPCSHSGQRWRIGLDGDDRVQQIEALAAGSAAAGDDWGGDWLSPMGVDLQINGGLGLAFTELSAADQPRLQQLLELLWRDGVEAICPTLVTCAVPPLRQALAVLRQARADHQPGRCRLLGAHLEGPFLAPARRGAHPQAHLCTPSLAALAERIDGFCGPADGPGGGGADAADIALVTLAPELEGAAAVIQALRDQGIVVSLGHSAANDSEAMAAYEAGVAMVTHAFNAMAGLGHRQPGPIAAAALRGDVALGLIADGVHVAPGMAVLLQRLAPGQVVLVSDALAPYGLAEGLHRWDERTLIVANGSCRLEDGTLAGVTLPLLEGARRLAGWSGRPEWAIAAATVLPRRVLGERRPLQELLVGRRLGDCLRWSADGEAGEGLHWRRAA
ncbi:MAG: N-acetylglucosamine-6-phosphate deacetylase [Cyanobacteria bacterium]|nr:N-acetylglucosamine-6-phosphate deacetylase [Cyanobacteriota bacterium]